MTPQTGRICRFAGIRRPWGSHSVLISGGVVSYAPFDRFTSHTGRDAVRVAGPIHVWKHPRDRQRSDRSPHRRRRPDGYQSGGRHFPHRIADEVGNYEVLNLKAGVYTVRCEVARLQDLPGPRSATGRPAGASRQRHARSRQRQRDRQRERHRSRGHYRHRHHRHHVRFQPGADHSRELPRRRQHQPHARPRLPARHQLRQRQRLLRAGRHSRRKPSTRSTASPPSA